MSGVESSQNREDAGVSKDSWYARARSAELPLFTELDDDLQSSIRIQKHIATKAPTPDTPSTQFELRDLVLSWLGDELVGGDPLSISPERQQALDEGVWFHGVLQRISPQQYRPVSHTVPEPKAIASAFMISLADAERALQRAITVYQAPELQTYFDPTQYQEAWNELDLVSIEGKSMRIDRLVELSDCLVILDYKLTLPKLDDLLYQQYTEQLTNYQVEVQRIYPHKAIKAILIDAQGKSLPLIH
jgi:ATP-dependent helicase/nuclease subunit A